MQSTISCHGVRTHNLKNINLEIPIYKWTAVTGVSGSGKSSLVFDTIYSEAQRRFLETLGTYERQFLQGLPQGDFESIENIPAAIALKQTNKTSDPRSVIASAADISEPLRNLFIALMDPLCSRCGTKIAVNRIGDLIDFFIQEQEKNLKKESFYLITVPYTFSKETKEKKKILENLLIEGYSRLLIKGEIVSIEELVSQKDLSLLEVSPEIILDRISLDIAKDELLNRLETIWSQVKFTPHFSYINVTEFAQHKKTTFHVQPFCQHCSSATTLIQQSDLDWQSVLGACPTCTGIGNIPVMDESKIVPNPQLSLEQGAIKPWSRDIFAWAQLALIEHCKKRKIKTNIPYQDLDKETRQWIWYGDKEHAVKKQKDAFFSLQDFFNILEEDKYKITSRMVLAKYRKYVTCPDCQGVRLSASGRNATSLGKHYYELFQCEISETLKWLGDLKNQKEMAQKLEAAKEIYSEVHKKIQLLCRLGLGSTFLFRRCKTLSGGEYQRVLLTRVIGNGLTDALYVLDEPSVGLGKQEVKELIACIAELRDLGNTILMVEHDKALIGAADFILELGPGGGENGGRILEIKGNEPASFHILAPLPKLPQKETKLTKLRAFETQNSLFIKKFSALNCQDLDIEILLGKLNVIAGPSGAGKSTIATLGIEAAIEKYVEQNVTKNTNLNIDDGLGVWEELLFPKGYFQTASLVSVRQKALHRTITSIPATVLGIMDNLRKSFSQLREAKERGLGPSDFSFNGEGGCEECGGKGVVEEDLFFLGSVEKECPSCNGKRYKDEVLEVALLGKNIHAWLATNLNECNAKLGPYLRVQEQIELACKLGLGHIPLGMPTSLISGGEAQRLRICAALTKTESKLFCILDEPTRGLSETDIGSLLSTLLHLTQEGHTFVVVEHHELFEKYAHHLIKIGPGSGLQGGKIVERIFRNY